MGATTLSIIIFCAIASISAAVFLLVRELLSTRGQTVEARLGGGNAQDGLPRLATPADARAVRSPIGRFDHWFSNLVTQTGTSLEPPAAFLIAVASGLFLGGALFLWHDHLVVGVVGGMIGIVTVFALLLYFRARYHQAILEQFPDTLELLARAVRAGESVEQAITFAGNNVADPLATEFRRSSGQLGMGLSLDAALSGFASRIPLAEIRILAATLMVQQRAGGNLPTTLECLARVCRDRLNYRRQHRAATMTGRGAAMLIIACAAGAAAYMWIWRPEYALDFLDTTQGQYMLAIAAVLQILGIVWIYRLLRVDY